MAGKKESITIYLIVYLITAVYFVIQTFNDWASFTMTIAFAVIAGLSLVVLLHMKTDDQYYKHLTPLGLVEVAVATLGMVATSSFFTGVIGETVFSTLLAVVTEPSSIVTNALSEMLFTLCLVATGEELLKLAGYSELKVRWGMVIAVIVAVGSWAAYHAIQAYSNPLQIIPIFLCGVIMVGLLEATKCFLAPILAHGSYNSVGIISKYLQGKTAMPNLPLFPTQPTIPDLFLCGLVIIWLVFIILPVLRRPT